MIEIIIGAIILLIVYLFIQDDSDKETKTEPIDQQLLETQEVDKSEKERLENLEHENFTVVYTYLSKDGKPSALIKRSGNTSTPFASVERSKTAFKLSENLYLQKRKANQWDWYDESEYQKQISLIQKQEKQAAKLFYEEQEAKRLKLYNFILPKIDEIKLAELEFKSKINYSNGYFSNYDEKQWLSKYISLYNKIKPFNYKKIHLDIKSQNTISNFIKFFQQSTKLREVYNFDFLEHELKTYESFFNDIEGRKLGIQQRKAIIINDDNNLIIAGAGAGKTTTIVGKVNYIINKYYTNPNEILLISFTNESAKTLADRINIEGLAVKTFHKFGKDVILNIEDANPSVFEAKQFSPLLSKIFKNQITDKRYLEQVTKYFIHFLKPPKSQFEFENQGSYIQYLKDKDFKTYKQKEIYTKGRLTYQKEVVKSVEECKIANFLLFNGINYEYEYPYEYKTANKSHPQYKPDFKIIQNERVVYLEHFGIKRNGDVPDWFQSDDTCSAREKYHEGIKWKRNIHKYYRTTLIETYSYEMFEGTLFKNLKDRLEQNGILLQPKTPKEKFEIIQNSATEEIKSFIKLFGTFITLMKSNNYTIQEILENNKELQDVFQSKRNDLFLKIIIPIYKQYEKHLEERNLIDFSDMINKASYYIHQKQYSKKFKYIIIDEFQDISIGRYKLIQALKDTNPKLKLYCVGDDWQSIYRFTGSDISLFKEFEDYFGFTVKSKIETTYRFNNPLISMSSNFVTKNPNQTKKTIIGNSQSQKTSFELKYSKSSNQDDTIALFEIFEYLIETYDNIKDKVIYILGRYSFDINRIKNEKKTFDIKNNIISYNKQIGSSKININAVFFTIHKAKGLEADIVIILNCNSGRYGFPSELSDDSALNMLLSEADQFENGEERRLFYVAMTRAKEKLFLITNSLKKSKFITELETENQDKELEKCPYCKTADLVIKRQGVAKNGNKYEFYRCSNYIYGCKYENKKWTNCN